MTGKKDFITLEIEPLVGYDHLDDFDLEGIFDEVADYDPHDGFVWKAELCDGDDDMRWDKVNEILKRHDITGVTK